MSLDDITNSLGTEQHFTPAKQKVPALDLKADIQQAEVLDGGTITEDGIAEIFARRHAGTLRYCHHSRAWFEWNGVRWRRDETARAFQYSRRLGREHSAGRNPAEIRQARKVAFASGVERFAMSDEAFAVTSEVWDQDLYLLGTPDGTVDLRTGNLRPAESSDGITKLTAVGPAFGVPCPRWLAFLDEATGGDAELIRFLRQWCGYSLTGDTREHAFVFMYGEGGNGKSVFLSTLTGIAGDYARVASMQAFTASKNDRHLTEIASLQGARIVTASETEHGKAWAEARLKSLTGGDTISARFVKKDAFEFVPQLKLTVVGNHKPKLQNVDEAMRRRLSIVPFTRKPANPDPMLERKLREEWPAILAWMIEGCLNWQANGLVRPDGVKAATTEYFETQDMFGQWLTEECDLEPGNDHKRETSAALYSSWSTFAKAAGEEAGSRVEFNDRLGSKGAVSRKGTGGRREYRGIRLQPKADRFADR
jgi:putative DNA primase/helicase